MREVIGYAVLYLLAGGSIAFVREAYKGKLMTRVQWVSVLLAWPGFLVSEFLSSRRGAHDE